MAVGIMEVLLVNAKGLSDADFLGGDSDPYVLIQYKGHERKSTVAKGDYKDVNISGHGNNPVWNEKFTFKVEYPGGDDKYKLVLKIMDKDTFSADDFLGEATIYIEDLLALGVENGTAELHPHKYRVVQADQTYRGEIQVGISFTPRVQEETARDAFGGWKQSDH